MKLQTKPALPLLLATLCLCVATLHAGDSTNTATEQIKAIDAKAGEQINWQVISSGGTDASSTHYILQGTAGQTATGQSCLRSYCVEQGYWYGGGGGPTYTCGDADGNTIVNISDAVFLIAYIFGGGSAPDPLLSGDADCNQIVNISDAVYLIAYIFGGGPAPCENCT